MSRFGKPENITEHHYFEQRLSAYLDGELLPQERDAVKHHLATCQACQWDIDTLAKTGVKKKWDEEVGIWVSPEAEEGSGVQFMELETIFYCQ